jgi:hypothetical protein
LVRTIFFITSPAGFARHLRRSMLTFPFCSRVARNFARSVHGRRDWSETYDLPRAQREEMIEEIVDECYFESLPDDGFDSREARAEWLDGTADYVRRCLEDSRRQPRRAPRPDPEELPLRAAMSPAAVARETGRKSASAPTVCAGPTIPGTGAATARRPRQRGGATLIGYAANFFYLIFLLVAQFCASFQASSRVERATSAIVDEVISMAIIPCV